MTLSLALGGRIAEEAGQWGSERSQGTVVGVSLPASYVLFVV